MATEKDVNDLFLNHVNSNDVKTRKMMGEYIIYYDGVVIGGYIYIEGYRLFCLK
ncbi:Putative cytosolic protein [Staphylococcus aureus]|nr:Putative cytosolic protein [Staphylococcus aureus]